MEILRPDPTQVAAVCRVLEDNQYPLPPHIVEASIAAHNAWLTSPEGRNHLASALNLSVGTGRSEDEYMVDGEPVPHTRVQLIYGYIIQGVPVNPVRVDVARKPLIECDFCNHKTVCAQEVKTAEGMYAFACSACVQRRDDLRLKYDGPMCRECTYTKCKNHEP